MCIRLIVDPALESKPPGVQLFVDEPEDGQAILTPLAEPPRSSLPSPRMASACVASSTRHG